MRTTNKKGMGHRGDQSKGKKADGKTKEVAAHLSVEMETNSDMEACHSLANITLTISPNKKKRVVAFVNADANDSKNDSNSDDDHSKNGSREGFESLQHSVLTISHSRNASRTCQNDQGQITV